MPATAEKRPYRTKQVPEVTIGDRVMFYAGGDITHQPAAAIVTGIGVSGALDLWVIYQGRHQPEPRIGVRHMSDPDLQDKPALAMNCGGWELTERDKNVAEIISWMKSEIGK